MTSKLKCPFCQTELEDAGIHSPELYFCCTNCYMKQKEKDDNYTASPRIWQLDIAESLDIGWAAIETAHALFKIVSNQSKMIEHKEI